MIDNIFSPDYQYYKGQYCVYNNTLYRAKTDIPVGTPFSTDNWEYRQIGLDLYSLNNSLICESFTPTIDSTITDGVFQIMNCYYIPASKLVHVEFSILSANGLIRPALATIATIPEKYRPNREVTSMAFLPPASFTSFQPTHYEKVNIPYTGTVRLNNFIYGTGAIKFIYVNMQYVID